MIELTAISVGMYKRGSGRSASALRYEVKKLVGRLCRILSVMYVYGRGGMMTWFQILMTDA